MIQAVLLNFFLSEPDTCAAAATLLQTHKMEYVYVCKNQQEQLA